MPRLIAFPFTLDGTGAVTTVEQDSDTEIDQQVALAMLTCPGERIQVPTFGVADPAFVGFQLGQLQRHLLDFGPQIEVLTLVDERVTEGQERVVITWQRRDSTREVPAQ